MAIALSAEYGERSCGGSSLIGSNCTNRCPADSSQRVSGPRSPISPMPQLVDDGIENSGTSIPARRDPGCDRVIGLIGASSRSSRRLHTRAASEVPGAHEYYILRPAHNGDVRNLQSAEAARDR